MEDIPVQQPPVVEDEPEQIAVSNNYDFKDIVDEPEQIVPEIEQVVVEE